MKIKKAKMVELNVAGKAFEQGKSSEKRKGRGNSSG
jgi:hypothetical protein